MKREELERLIVDASDGVLTASEIEKLENELHKHPDLYEDYQSIMKLPDLSTLYPADLQTENFGRSIQNIKQSIRDFSYVPDSFEVISLNWFRRYALAASLAVFAITSLFSLIPFGKEQVDSEEVVEEYFYPVDENSIAENYVLYLEDLSGE
ncbi:hypothetical protein [Rhodohalobacter sp. 614A]|uniref:hypothetical protein n=1 Tax=Rhodohalobacter sp. 614A TaxID=2908649 RepID=UPI001F30ED06|nr:hypothetical protein [Rhodohalobacter sp. 614A]